jgi:tetratricopeptide (TPR) repeat protein
MVTKSENNVLSELLLLAKAEEDLKVSKDGVKTIETLKKIKSVGKNQRFKTLLDNSVMLISEKQQTIRVILTIGTLYYNQSEDKTSICWLLKYLTKLKLEMSQSESEKKYKTLKAEYILGCCYYNLNNFKMAYKSLKTSPPDPSNVSKYKIHCNMLFLSCKELGLHDEMSKYAGLFDENSSDADNVWVRIDNAKLLIQFGKIAGAKQHLKEASNMVLNGDARFEARFEAHKNGRRLWAEIKDLHSDLKMYHEAYKFHQNFVDGFKGSLDPPPYLLLLASIQMAKDINSTLIGSYQKAISICQYVLELLQKAPEGYSYLRWVVFYQMANSYYWLNDFGSAIKYYEETLEETKRDHKNCKIDMVILLSRVWLSISESQLLSGSYQEALKSAKKSAKYLKPVHNKPLEHAKADIQLSYCWRKLKHPQKAVMFMESAIKICQQTKDILKKEGRMEEVEFIDPNRGKLMESIDTQVVFICACEHQLHGMIDQTEVRFKALLQLQEEPRSLEQVLKTLHFCAKGGRTRRIFFPEDGQLFWSRMAPICCNDDNFVSQLPTGFKKAFLQYKNSLEICKHFSK